MEAGRADAGRADAGRADATPPDAGRVDAVPPNAGPAGGAADDPQDRRTAGRPPILGLVLAGGEGRRMGGMKPFVLHRGRPLIDHALARLAPQADRILVNVGQAGTALAARLEGLGRPVVADDPALAGRGPLSGVQAGLAAARAGGAWLLTLPCDVPEAPADLGARLIRAMTASGAPVAYVLASRPHPLCALWHPELLEPLTRALMAAPDGLRVMPFLAAAGALAVPGWPEAAFANVNRPEDAAP